MSYVVLARKYRPLRFDDMVGQEHVGRTLGNAIRQDRVHHAYLFAGARGLGKTTTARIFAKGLVCEQGPTPTPCNTCSECVAVNEGRSVDVVEIDGASNNSVDNIRNLREQVNYLPQTARRKVYIIDEVHMLTTSAFNALLKTLEEPPAHVNFIFATTEPHKVLPTILSRVSRLDFRRISPQESVEHLKSILQREELSVDDGGLQLIARASGGSVRDGLTLLDQVIAFSEDPKAVSEDEARRVLGQAQRQSIAELVDAVLERDPDAVVSRFDALITAGHDLMVLSMQLLEHFRDLAVVKVCKGPDVLRGATDSEYELLRTQAAKAESAVLGQLFDRFTRVVDRLPTSRVPRLLLEMGLLDLAHSEALVPLGDLLDQLHNFTEGGGGGGGATGGAAPTRGGGGSQRGGGSSRQAAPPVDEPLVRSDPPEPPRQPPPRQPPPSPPVQSPEPAVVAPPAPTSENVPTQAAGKALIGDEDSAFSKQLWAKVKGDLGDAESAQGETGTAPAGVGGEPSLAPEPTPPIPSPQPSNGELKSGGPCPPRPAAATVIVQEGREAFEVWEELVARIRAADEYVSAVLSELALLELGHGIVRVAAPARSFAYTELTTRPDIRSALEQACRDHLGAPHEVQLVEGEADLPERPSIVLVDAQRRAAHQAAIEAEAREHASIRSLVANFDAKITATKPLQ